MKKLLLLIPILFSGCTVDHVISGEGVIHVNTDLGCQWNESPESGNFAVICDDGKHLMCITSETENVYVCQRVE